MSSFRGDLGGLTAEEMEQFLAGNPVARLATLKPDGSPYVMPVWYQWDGEALYFVGRQRALWCQYIKADGRVERGHRRPPQRPRRGRPGDGDPQGLHGRASPPSRRSPTSGAAGCRSPSRCRTGTSVPNGPDLPGLNSPAAALAGEDGRPPSIKTWKGVGWARRYWVRGQRGPKSYEEAHSHLRLQNLGTTAWYLRTQNQPEIR